LETRISAIINDIKDRTGIDVTVFNASGEIVSATSYLAGHKHPGVSPDRFTGGVYVDEENGATCFLFSTQFNIYYGVTGGTDETSRNYAYMIAALIDSAAAGDNITLSRQDCLRELLTGETSHHKIQKLVRKYSSLNMPCYVLAIVCPAVSQADVLNFMRQLAGDGMDIAVSTDDDMAAYVRYIDRDGDYQSALDFAEMVQKNIEQELSVSVSVGVGSYAGNASELYVAYSQAAGAVRSGMASGGKGGLYSYKEFILMRMLEEIPRAAAGKYLDILLDSGAKEILNDRDMLETAEAFLANSLNISETSRHLYMHRNTLMYRLDKIEKAMGLNIRRFSDASAFRIIMLLYESCLKR
jgi:carbohydrate diacid regulator